RQTEDRELHFARGTEIGGAAERVTGRVVEHVTRTDARRREAANQARPEEVVVDHAQIAAGGLDVTTLDAGDTDELLEEFAIIAGVRRDAQELRVAADTGELRLDLG